ncbi:hypothetical protein BGW38_003244, partial [Lunasporangiospora selenospora]
LPKSFSLVPRVFGTQTREDAELLEHSYIGPQQQQQQQQQQQSPPTVFGGQHENGGGEGNSGSSGLNYLLEQRRLLENVQLEPLPRPMIASYRPGYSSSEPHPSDSNSNKDREKEEQTNREPSTKFLTFLPHSGFHNQRSELENALLLARLLNRTLIMPKVYLGPPMPWLTFPQLHSRLLYQTKIGLEHCRAIIETPEYESKDNSKDKTRKQKNKDSKKPANNNSSSKQKNSQQDEKKQQQQQQQQPQTPPSDLLQQPQHVMVEEQGKQLGKPTDTPIREQLSPISIPAKENTVFEGWPNLQQESNDHQTQEPFQPSETSAEETESPSDTMVTEDTTDNDTLTNDDFNVGEDDSSEDGAASDEEIPSWIEESDDDDQTQASIATGDNVEDIMDIDVDFEDEESTDQDVDNWNQIREEEDTEIDGDADEEDVEEDFNDTQVGIVDDEDEDYDDRGIDDGDMPSFQRGWNPTEFWASQDRYPGQRSRLHHHHRNRANGRFLSQQTLSEASLPLYRHLDPIKPQENTVKILKRSISTDQDLRAAGEVAGENRPPSEPEAIVGTQYHHQETFVQKMPDEYVRILTRESMSMEYLETRFYLKAREEDFTNTTTPGPSDATTSANTKDGEGEEESEAELTNDDGNDNEHEQEQEQEGDGSGDEKQKKVPPPLLRTVGDVLFFEDTNLYDYRFTENPNAPESVRTRSKYGQEFTIDWLKQRPERLIHLGSIFGTGRVSIDSLQSKSWHLMIRDHLILGTEILQTTSQKIVDKISGTVYERDERDTIHIGNDFQDGLSHYSTQEPPPMLLDPLEPGFVGIHIRMSDGHFSLSARETIENIRQELMWQVGIQDPTQSDPVNQHQDSLRPLPLSSGSGRGRSVTLRKPHLSIEQCRARAQNHRQSAQAQMQREYAQAQQQQIQSSQAPGSPQPNKQSGQQHAFDATSHEEQTSSESLRRSNGRYTPIYLATDAHHPRANPIFDRLFDTFECIFTLEDFEEDLEELYQFRNPEDGARMAKFLIPMVDAMVVAKAAAFFGTPASTFSNYIQKQLRPAYTGLYD